MRKEKSTTELDRFARSQSSHCLVLRPLGDTKPAGLRGGGWITLPLTVSLGLLFQTVNIKVTFLLGIQITEFGSPVFFQSQQINCYILKYFKLDAGLLSPGFTDQNSM